MWEEKLKLYDELVDQCSKFDRKGKTMPYTSANGYMFSLLNKNAEFGIRFSKKIQEQYFEKYNTTYYKSYGATMKGYILIPNKVLENQQLMCELLNESYDYVMTLEPK